jgi:ubiquinone/menaquinone biosynthesis C-methylase UbiE
MDHKQAGEYWDGNAETWTKLARAGYDVYRDAFNTPGFLRMLPDVSGLEGLDIGCGEGHNTRLVASRGAKMAAIDISETFIRHAMESEREKPMGIRYQLASALELPFADNSFDFAVAFMSLMDVPEYEKALAEAARVLRPGGFLQFSICHPCTDTPYRKNLRDANRVTYALELGGYFNPPQGKVNRWLFGAAPKEIKAALEPFATPWFHHTLSEWFNAVIAAGLVIEEVQEPFADDAAAKECPDVQDSQVMPYFLHIRART